MFIISIVYTYINIYQYDYVYLYQYISNYICYINI